MRLRVNGEGVLVPDPKAMYPGRSAWICFKKSCVNRLLKKPNVLRHRLKRPVPRLDGLPDAILAHIDAQILIAIRHCWRSGLVISGAQATKQDRIRSNILVVAIAKDASSKHIQQNYSTKFVFNIELSKINIGRCINKGPRAVVGFLEGAPTSHLLRWLQRRSTLR